MTRTEIHRHAQVLSTAVLFAMPTAIADALSETEMDDLLQLIRDGLVFEIQAAMDRKGTLEAGEC